MCKVGWGSGNRLDPIMDRDQQSNFLFGGVVEFRKSTFLGVLITAAVFFWSCQITAVF